MRNSHIQIIVKKIMALEPNLILVGNNVSKHALDLFLRVWSGWGEYRSARCVGGGELRRGDDETDLANDRCEDRQTLG